LNDNPDNLIPRPEKIEAEQHKSPGDKKFDRWLYAGLNGVGTFVVTVPLAYWAAYSNNGGKAKLLEKATTGIEKVGVGKGFAERFAMMLATSLGGWAMVAPTWVAEHFRKPIVAKLNEGQPKADADHPYKEIPKQTIGSLLRGRLLAMATVTASFWTAEHFFRDHFKAFEEKVGQQAVDWFGKYAKNDNQLIKIRRYGEISALDVFATTAATILLYVGSRFFARHRKHPLPGDAETLHTAHNSHTPMKEEAPSATLTAEETGLPETTIGGQKHHPGKVVAMVPALEVTAERA
jgi:hypothetical protein